MKKLFILGSCRIHRPLNCDYSHTDGKHTLYDCLETRWGEKCFLGSLYCSQYILQTLRCLIFKENKDYIQIRRPHIAMNDAKFLKLCESFYKSEIVVIEIATIKYMFENGRYYSNECIKNTNNVLTNDELILNIKTIEKLLSDVGKKVLFVSHFTFNNIHNRQLIVDCLKKASTRFFDPSCIIENNKNMVIDSNHYTQSTEKLIMNAMHDHLSKM